MPRSSETKSVLSSGFEATPSGAVTSEPGGQAASGPAIRLNGVSLRFSVYQDKTRSLKQAAVSWLVGRLRAAIGADQQASAAAADANAVPNSGQRQGFHFWALRDVRLEVGAGQRVGIVGHNGAGKTTLLKLISRIYTPTIGNVSVHGRLAPLMDLGAAFNPELSARENILLHGALFGIDRRTMLERTQKILEFAEVTEFADLQLKYFSAGMTGRLAFSIATDVEPEILLVDEVFATGDARFRQKAQERMRTLMGRSHIVLMTSHDMGLVAELCDRVLLMRHGRIVCDGAPEVVVKEYDRQLRQQGRPPRREAIKGPHQPLLSSHAVQPVDARGAHETSELGETRGG